MSTRPTGGYQPTAYQTALNEVQANEKEAGAVGEKPSIGMRIYAFFKTSGLLKGLQNTATSATDRGHNIRQLARFQDTLDYGKLSKDKVRSLQSKISTPHELVHFCMKYNPTQLQKAGIISEEECNTLKNLFDKTCEAMPELEFNMRAAVTSGKTMQDVTVHELYENTVGTLSQKSISEDENNILSRGIKDDIDRMSNNKQPSDFSKPDAPSIKELHLARIKGFTPIVRHNQIPTDKLPNDKRTFHDVVLSCMGDTERKCEPLENAMASQKSVHNSFSGVGPQKAATLDDWVKLYNGDYLKTGCLTIEFVTAIGEFDLQNPQSIESFRTFCKLTGRPEPTLPKVEPYVPSKEDKAALKRAKAEAAQAQPTQPDKGAIDTKLERFDQKVSELSSIKKIQQTIKTKSEKTESITVEQWKMLLSGNRTINSATLASTGKIDNKTWENLDKALQEEIKELDSQCTTLRNNAGNEGAPSHTKAIETSDVLFNLNNKISTSGLIKKPIELSFKMEEKKRK